MNSLKIIINAAVALVLLCSCNAGGATAAFSGGDTVKLEHAQLLHIIKHKGYTVVTINDPWNKGKTLHTYILVPDGMKSPVGKDGMGGNTTLVNIPLKRAVITTSVHCGLVMNFGKGDAIRGTCDLNYINIPWIKQQHSIGKIADCGNSTTPTLEKIIAIDADAVLISPFQNSGGYGRLDEWGNPIIEMADYMETSPLGRAEWMKFYGLLFGAEKEADSLFNKVENINDTQVKYNQDKRALYDRWQKPGDVAKFKRIDDTSATNMSSRFIADDNTLELTTLSVGYETTTAPWLQTIGASAFNVRIYGNNLFRLSTIKEERGIDYPFSRNISASVGFRF